MITACLTDSFHEMSHSGIVDKWEVVGNPVKQKKTQKNQKNNSKKINSNQFQDDLMPKIQTAREWLWG